LPSTVYKINIRFSISFGAIREWYFMVSRYQADSSHRKMKPDRINAAALRILTRAYKDRVNLNGRHFRESFFLPGPLSN
jgi:hypothetical protein